MTNIALELLFERDKGRCSYCGREVVRQSYDFVNQKKMGRQACIDHIIPQSRGGSHSAGNLLLACRSCNSRKKDRDLEDFRERYTYDELGMPRFTNAQREWLESYGFEFPQNIKFYFETRSD